MQSANNLRSGNSFCTTCYLARHIREFLIGTEKSSRASSSYRKQRKVAISNRDKFHLFFLRLAKREAKRIISAERILVLLENRCGTMLRAKLQSYCEE
jgi:hypothetical protein